jgi:putative flippase GtrA
VLLNSTLLYLILDFKNIIVVPKPYFVAFIGATGFSSVFNFLGQKFWVFKNQPIFEED